MKASSLIWYARRPLYLLQSIAYKFRTYFHPDEPWIAPDTVLYCEKVLNSEMTGLEWGSGRSTVWFGKRIKKLLSIEHDQSWYSRVSLKLREASLDHVEYRWIPLDHPLEEPTYAFYPVTPLYVKVVEEFEDQALDFVVVDGHYRQACILAVLPKIKPNGLLLVDNTQWMPLKEWGVPGDWPVIHQGRNFMTETTVWRKPALDSEMA